MNTENNYTFKEVCDITGYKASVIRYYEKEFKLDIPRDTNGRRNFSKFELDRLLFIKRLQEEGYNNSQIKKKLENTDKVVSEVAVTSEMVISSQHEDLFTKLDERLGNINKVLNELHQSVTGKDKDLIISENLKLKMELKEKAYEIIQLKEKLRYEKEKNKGFLSKIFKSK